MSTIVFPLLALECMLALALFHRRLQDYPLTCIVQLAVAGLYAALMLDFYGDGPLAYRVGVEATRPLFRAAMAIVAAESVMLMAQGIPNVRWFAAATSMVFAGLTGMAMLAGERLVPGTAGIKWSFLWSMGCVVYLMANHWLYQRAKPLNPLAARHASGAMVMLLATAVALGLAAWSEGRGVLAAMGHVVGVVGPIGVDLVDEREIVTKQTLTNEDVAGVYSSRIAAGKAASGEAWKSLYAVVEIDQYGGHRHWFRVVIAGKNPLTTESLAAAMRQYNKGGKA